MPQRTVKKGAAAKRAKTALENNNHNDNLGQEPETAEAVVNNHEEEEENIANDEKSVLSDEKLDDVKNKEEEVKESIDEYEKDEQLDFEDNYPEYEPLEDYNGVDYDEKEIEQDEHQEVRDEVEEECEVVAGEDDISGDEEIEYVYEEVEVDEDDEHNDEEHDHSSRMADAEQKEHPEGVNKRHKQKEFEVFVGGLYKDATEEDLRKVFGEVGVITEVRLMMNPHTKKNRGFAFLHFETIEQAKKAATELKNPVINGKQCRVSPVQDNDTIYLGNICKTWKLEALKDKLRHYGVGNFENLTLVEDSNNEGMNRGFAFLDFSSRSEARKAYTQLQKRDVVFGVDKPAEISFTDSFIDPVDDIMAQVKTVFIDSLPPSWDEDYVRDLLKKYGEIEKIELAKNMPAASRKDFGFVTFGTHAAAVECADSITSSGLGEGDKKAKVKARLSRPLRKGSRKHVSHAAYSSGRNSGILSRPSRARPAPRSLPARMVRRIESHVPPGRPFSVMDRRPVSVRDRRPVMSMSLRSRPVSHLARSSERRLSTSGYPKSSMKRDYGLCEELPPPRSRVAVDYGSRMSSQKHLSYRDYPAHGSRYPELRKGTSRTSAAAPMRSYVDDGYGQRFERPPLSSSHFNHREGHSRDYETLSGSKRTYSVIDDAPPRYADTGARQSRSRLDYEYGGSISQYGDAYGDRLGRSSLGYSNGRSSISTRDSHGMYSSRQSTSYSAGSFGGSDRDLYSASYGGDYISRGSNAGGRSYSSMYSSRGVGGSSSYMSGSRSRSYY
ncbi:uncharacterized protein LOC130974041 [Arachis stenosperma]|uniref:uncharacterized protein LOC130974041 n=1 Tax=Arachis stenosperma TaxID=217475 RepID=UPI0025AD7175|nr:uncharacterized protein LOC130974041 [Arachis stenosperma]